MNLLFVESFHLVPLVYVHSLDFLRPFFLPSNNWQLKMSQLSHKFSQKANGKGIEYNKKGEMTNS